MESRIINEMQILINIRRRKDNKLRQGIQAHAHHYNCPEGHQPYIKMYRWIEFDEIMELRSAPFKTIEEAERFRDCFNDNFLEEAYVKDMRVYTGWIEKFVYISYKIGHESYYEFANWS